jgi:hypothetical protein
MNWLVLNGFSLSALRRLVNRAGLRRWLQCGRFFELLRRCALAVLYRPTDTVTELLATLFEVRIKV